MNMEISNENEPFTPEEGASSEDTQDDEDSMLNENQKAIFKYVTSLLNDEKFRSENKTAVMVTGPSGTGKTFLLNFLDNHVRNNLKRQVMVAASMGVTALNFEHGRTGHSMFGFPRKYSKLPNTSCGLLYNENFKTSLLENIQQSSLIIYDNVNLEDRRKIEMLDTFLKNRLKSKLPFGGKLIIFSADFLQLDPVSGLEYSLKFSDLFQELMHFSLDQNMHVEDEYFQFLNTIRSNTSSAVELLPIRCVESIDEVLEFVFPINELHNPDIYSRRVIMHPNTTESREINADIMKKLVPEVNIKIYQSIKVEHNEFDSAEDDEEDILPEENLELWNGSVCMFVKSHLQFLVGHRVIVEEMGDHVITIRKPESKDLFRIERQIFQSNNKKFKQFPLRLCHFATTVHKAQGQIFERAGVDLRENVFRHGQLYTALSRVRDCKDIIVCYPGKVVKNKVEKNML